MLVDTHCHLFHPWYEKDLEEVLERAKKAGVVYIINSGTNHSTNLKVLALAKKYPKLVKASLGIYPVDAVIDKADPEHDTEPIDIASELAFIKKNKDNIIAIGEVGLDYHLIQGKEKKQQNIF